MASVNVPNKTQSTSYTSRKIRKNNSIPFLRTLHSSCASHHSTFRHPHPCRSLPLATAGTVVRPSTSSPDDDDTLWEERERKSFANQIPSNLTNTACLSKIGGRGGNAAAAAAASLVHLLVVLHTCACDRRYSPA